MSQRQRLSRRGGLTRRGAPTSPSSFHHSPKPFQSRRLRGPVPVHFEAFYRSELRFVPGQRLKSSKLNDLYANWAIAAGAPSLSEKEIKRAMLNIGHRSKRADGIRYCDVALASMHAGLSDNFPGLQSVSESRARGIADRLDAMITELTSIRTEVFGAHSHTDGVSTNDH